MEFESDTLALAFLDFSPNDDDDENDDDHDDDDHHDDAIYLIVLTTSLRVSLLLLNMKSLTPKRKSPAPTSFEFTEGLGFLNSFTTN